MELRGTPMVRDEMDTETLPYVQNILPSNVYISPCASDEQIWFFIETKLI